MNESTVKRAKELISENRALTRTLYPPDQAIPEPSSSESLHHRLRSTHSPFAPLPKRPRAAPLVDGATSSQALIPQAAQPSAPSRAQALASETATVTPHPKWRLFRLMSGHLGWVRCVTFDPSNLWFATGSSDRTIKIWDSASGRLRLTLTGHVSGVRALAVSAHRPYMFSAGEDKAVKCWDLERNTVIRHYHGHLSGVYSAAVHPAMDILCTGGRDSTVRVWDVRTRAQVMILGGHRDTVNAVVAQQADPQVMSASADATIRLWDLAGAACRTVLTQHRKGVRALVTHPREWAFISAAADAVKTWALPDGIFMRNWKVEAENGVCRIVNAVAVNEDGVTVTGEDDGRLRFWDYKAGRCFDRVNSVPQPGSLDCEAGILALSFDRSGSRLVSCEMDKTVRMWKEYYEEEEDDVE